MKLVPVTRLTEAEWEAYYAMRLDIRARYQPAILNNSPKRGPEYFKKYTLDTNAKLGGTELVLLKSNTTHQPQATGWLRFFPHGDTFSGSFDYLADQVPLGFLRIFAQGMQLRFKQTRAPHATFFLDDERIINALRRMAPHQEIPFNQLILDTEQVQQDRLATWANPVQHPKAPYTLEWVEQLPDHIHQDYLRLHNSLHIDLELGGQENLMQPTTQQDLFRIRDTIIVGQQTMLQLFLRDHLGARIGLTELTYSPNTRRGIQGITGITRPYRGKGLAKAIKAVMFQEAIARFPEMRYISTTTNAHNAPMMAINTEMGFTHYQTSSRITFTPDNVSAFLESLQQKRSNT